MLVAVVDRQRRGFKDTLDKLIAAALPAPAQNAAPAPPPDAPRPPARLPFPAAWKPWLAWAPVALFPLLYALALLALVTLSAGASSHPGGR